MVREWDPRTAPAAEIVSMLDTLNAVLTADLPDDPLWQDSHLREYLAETMPGERRISWIAEEEPGADGRPGRITGHANVLLLGDIGVVELLVHPAARRSGLGHEMLATAAQRVYHEGFSSVGRRGGRRHARASLLRVGRLRPGIRGDAQRAATRHCGLVVPGRDGRAASAPATGWSSSPAGRPTSCIEPYAKAKAEVRELDDGDLDLRPSSYDPQRLRDSLDCLHRRGMKPYIVLAIHEKTGAVAGLTEVVVPAQHPTRADQYDTIVVQDHRGYGIDRAIKARMLFELRSAEPKLTEVQTWNAQANESMLKVNAELGFQPDREWYEYGADVAELVRRLEKGA